jgi:competence protein ComEC
MSNQLFVLSFIIGVIIAYLVARFPHQEEVIFLIFLPALLGLCPRLRRLAAGAALGFLLVFLAASYHQSKQLASELWQVPQEIQLRVESLALVQGRHYQYRVYSSVLKQSFLLSHYSTEQVLAPGLCYRLTAKLKPRHALGNPTTRGAAKQAWVNREFVQGTLVNKKPVIPMACAPHFWSLDSLRFQIRESIERSSISARAQALVLALILGDRSRLSRQDWEVFQQTGTAHLMAISGLHIGLVYLLTYWGLGLFLRPAACLVLRINLLITASVLALMTSGIYVLISGAGISSLRAWGMLCLVTLMLLRREKWPGFSVLLVVVALILFLDPLAGLGMGLWLSAGAVFALIWLGAKGWQVHWKLALMLFPLSALWLKATLLSPFANAFAIPWVSFLIIPGAMLSLILELLGVPGGGALMEGVGWMIDKLWICLAWLGGYGHLLKWSLLSLSDQLLFYALMVCLLLPWRLLGVLPFGILVAALTWARLPQPEPGMIWIHVIDAGQGTAILIQTEDKNLLFDAGHPVVKDYLQYYRVTHLDKAVISHNDRDHRQGLAPLLKEISVDTLYAGERLMEVPLAEQIPCVAGQAWRWGEVDFQFLSPTRPGFSGNNASCVLRISLGDQSLLLTGDIEKKMEAELLDTIDPTLLKASVLISPHHGSKTSSTLDFLKAVSPAVVIYPTGFLNGYHHPHPDVTARVAALGARQYNTAQDGALRVKLSSHRIESIDCYKKLHPRWWSMDEEALCSGYLPQEGP